MTIGAPAFPHRSFWSEDYGAYAPSLQLVGDTVTDVLIIGAGFTGLSAAINLKLCDRALRVLVIEQEAVGFGASGRNSGWVWPNVATYHDILAAHGVGTLRETYAYAKRAYEYVGGLVKEHGLDSEYRETGLLRPSVSPEYEKDRMEYAEFCEKLGRADMISEMTESDVRNEYASPLFHKALWDRELALIHPVRHARSLAKLARSLDAEIFEQTPAIEIVEEPHSVRVATPRAAIRADRVILATNAYTHLLSLKTDRGLARRERPVIAFNTVTRPLTEAEWTQLKWRKRNAIYTFGPASHFGNPTHDGRLHWCSDRFIGVPQGRAMGPEYDARYNPTLKKQTDMFFPCLRDAELTHHWGGPIAATIDRFFHVGELNGNGRIFLSIGCNGNGVSLTHLNGKILADLVTDTKTELTALWFVNRPTRLWPAPEIATRAIHAFISIEKWRAKRRAIKAGLRGLVEESDWINAKS